MRLITSTNVRSSIMVPFAMPPTASQTFASSDLELQLERILSHPKFMVADQLSRFLR